MFIISKKYPAYIINVMVFMFITLNMTPHPKCVYAKESGISYNVKIYGVDDKNLLSNMNLYLDLFLLEDQLPPTIHLLKKRADGDKDKIIKLLKAKGYFKAATDIDINSKESPVAISVRVNTGRRFLLKTVTTKITGTDSHELEMMINNNETGLSPGKPFQADAIPDARQKLVLFLKRKGFPFVKIEKREIIADHSDETVSVTFIINPGQKAMFGDVTIDGIESVDQSYIIDKVMWKQGEIYNVDLVRKTQRKLTGLGLFTIIRIIEGDKLDEKGSLPITIELKERKHKSIGAGLFYKSDEGPGIKTMWENRNLMGKGEKLSANLELSGFKVAAEGMFRKTDFYREDQMIRLELRIAEDQPDAYKSTYLETVAIIERKLSEHLDIGVGLAYKSSKVEQINLTNSYNLFSVPLLSRWNNTDDLLDPKKGNRISFEVTPFYDTSGTPLTFTKGLIDFRYYYQLFKSPSINLATNLTLGTVYGADHDEIPADERFYAGGGGSVRGYAYQSIGPYSNGSPVGGKSLFEISVESRIRISEKLGVAVFIDGGNAFNGQFLSSKDDLKWGTGAGIRYFTPVGPLRFDVGFPLNRRSGIDDSFQVYISLGQAF